MTEEGSKGNLDSSSTETAPSYVSSVRLFGSLVAPFVLASKWQEMP